MGICGTLSIDLFTGFKNQHRNTAVQRWSFTDNVIRPVLLPGPGFHKLGIYPFDKLELTKD